MTTITHAELAQVEVNAARRIKVARQTRGLTLQDVGDVLGIDGRHVHAWEAGRRNPGPKHLAKLAEVLGLQVADLLPK